MRARGLAREDCVAVGDSGEDLTVAAVVGAFWLVANAFEHDPGLRAELARHPNARVAEATHGAGVYEAVVTTLAQAVSGEVIGRSVQGRADHAHARRRPRGAAQGPRRRLHPRQRAGRPRHRRRPAPVEPRARDASCCSCATSTPTASRHHARTNAHGVDLNRNSPEHWAGAGARPWSEPETRAIRDLILRELPALSIYYHQPFGLVDVPEGGRPQAARRYSELTGLPLHRLSRRPGSISRWQNARVQPGSAFVVELAPGPLPADLRLRHVAAVLAL